MQSRSGARASRPAHRCSSHSWAAYLSSLAGRQRHGGGARRAGGADPRQHRGSGVRPGLARHRQRPVARVGVHRLLPQPLQPAAGRAARRRTGDGGDGAVDVVRRVRRDDPGLAVIFPNPIILLILVFASFPDLQRWQQHQLSGSPSQKCALDSSHSPRALVRRRCTSSLLALLHDQNAPHTWWRAQSTRDRTRPSFHLQQRTGFTGRVRVSL